MRSKSHKKLTWLTLLMFCFTFFNNVLLTTAKADETSTKAVQSDAVAVLAGDFLESNGMGANWDPANYKGQLKEFKNGIYEEAFSLKAGEYQYKIAMNGKWDESYAGKNTKDGNTVLKLTQATKVCFRLDLKKGEVYDSINTPDQFKTKAILAGGIDNLLDKGQAWNPGDDNFKLDYIGGGFYKKTFPIKESAQANDYNLEYKVSYNGAWNNGEAQANASVKIPKGTKEITILSNYLNGIVTDSITNPEILNTASLIGTVRGDKDTWNEKSADFDMYNLDSTKFMYTKMLKAGSYEYKTALNHSWNNPIPANGNASLKLDADKNVVFIADLKTQKVIDSVNNPDDVKVALGLKAPVVTVKSPIINESGSITFSYKAPQAKNVYLAGNMTNWADGKKLMTKNADGVWSITLRVGDKAQKLQYKFIVDDNWVTDPCNTSTADGNSALDFPEYTGRIVTLPGSIQTAIGGTAWSPADKNVQFTYTGNGNYKLDLKNVKAGQYEYKVAMNYKWDPENYGLNGVLAGANIPITIPNTTDVTFLYNDDSHQVTSSLNYKVLDIVLFDGTKQLCKLTDEKLTGVYSGKADLAAGTYTNLSLEVKDENKNSKKVSLEKLVVDKDKTITFSYDPTTEITFNDNSNVKLDTNAIKYNSRSEEYKKPYGATPVGTPISFSIKTNKDEATQVKIILGTKTGTLVKDLSKNGSYPDGSGRWTITYTPNEIGTYSYYFVISNGADVKAYGDDDGYFGEGKAANIGEVKNYEFNVQTKNFKTPDWLKNGVIYQIFPDRFFNGDRNNDYLQKYARGTDEYEFPSDWYRLPEDPQLENDPSYKNYPQASKGDGVWSNDMYGGDLKGIEQKVQYLKSLGVTILYLNPIGQSISNHRYDTTDYSKVDPLLGNMDDFVSLANAAKKNGMHIILDGVYNHVSDDSIYFDRYGKYMAKGKPIGAYQYWSRVYDLMNEKGLKQQEAEKIVTADLQSKGITDLHYKDWFVISNKWLDKDSSGKELPKIQQRYDYEGWWGYDSMPVIQALNGSEYQVKSWANEVIDGKDAISRQWLRKGSSGWRLDVANEVSDETWRAFRTAVKSEGDNAIIGEIWTDASKYILGDMYDSVMNYRFRGALINYVKGTQDDNKTIASAKDSMNELEKMREQYPREALEAMMNLVDSHDTQRVISALDGVKKSEKGFPTEASKEAKQKMRLIPFIQMTYVGAPTIYYGDEIGMVGCDDPDNRRAFTWGVGDKDLVQWYAKLAAIRKAYSSLRNGDLLPSEIQAEYADDVMAYVRKDSDSQVLVASNRQNKQIQVQLSTPGIADGTKLTNILNTKEVYTVQDGKVTVSIPAVGGVILVNTVKSISVNYAGLADAYDGNKVAVRETPVSSKNIIASIDKAKDGDTVVISTMNEGISKDVLQKLVDLKKKLNIVIKRGNVTLTVKDVAGLKAALEAIGMYDLQLVFNGNVLDQNTIKNLNANIVAQVSFSTNLKDGKLGTDVDVQVPVDSKYNGKTLFVYYVDNSGKFTLVSKENVKDSMLTFTVNHFSGYVVSDKEIVINPNNNQNNNQNNNGKTPNQTNPQNTGTQGNNGGTLVKTGSAVSTTSIIILALLLTSVGAVLVVRSRRRVRDAK